MHGQSHDAERSIEERILLSLPAPVIRLLSWAFAALPLGSHVRRRVVKRFVARTYEGLNREDDVLALLIYEPDITIVSSRDFARLLGLPQRYSGHEGYLAWWQDVRHGMEEVRCEPEQVIDLGSCIAIRLGFLTRGGASQAITTRTVGIVARMTPRGRVPRLEWYWTWDEALAALEDNGGAPRLEAGAAKGP